MGEVTEVGREVQKFKVGDKVGVGCMVASCRSCESCANDCENYCPNVTVTDGAFFFKTGEVLYGGCSDIMVADENFVISWPENFPLDAGAPLLCAGITTYSPLKNFGLDKPGKHIGIYGLGGLGHVAVRFAKAFGAKVTVISSSNSKRQEAIENLGADSFLVSSNSEEMQVITV